MCCKSSGTCGEIAGTYGEIAGTYGERAGTCDETSGIPEVKVCVVRMLAPRVRTLVIVL